jgi:hypothetical protein
MNSSNNFETSARPLFQRLNTWYRLWKLQGELRTSEKFRRECEKLQCFTLAEVEEDYGKEIKEKISRLKTEIA